MRLAADENFDGRVLRGLRLRRPDLDVVRVQDVGLDATDDRAILAWAAEEGRVLLSHDVRTMSAFAVERIHASEPLAGLVIVPQSDAVGRLIDALIQLVDEHLETHVPGLLDPGVRNHFPDLELLSSPSRRPTG